MAELIYNISGNSTGLAKAVNDSIALLQNLQLQVNKLGNGAVFTGLGSAIQTANNQALQLNKTLSDTSLSAQDKGGIAALDALGRKLLIIKGNTELFGDSIKNQTAELGAYQTALNKLLSLGFEPLDGDVTRIKANIDNLTASIAAASVAQPKRPEISNSLAEATIFNQSTVTNGPIANSGTSALIAEFDKDLAAGKITAEQYRIEIERINASQAAFAKSTAATSVQLEEEIGILEGLKAELRSLQAAKITLVNAADIAKQNALIQELEAEITRFNNVGKKGFDASGVAIKNFGKETENAAKGGIAGLGRGLTSVFGSVRQLAYILPGIGIAGIFGLAFEAISKATEGIDLFNKKLDLATETQKAFNSVIEDTGKNAAPSLVNLKILSNAISDTTLSIKDRVAAAEELKKQFPEELANTSALSLVNGDLKKSYDEITKSIYLQAAAEASLTAIKDQEAKKQALIAQQLEIQAKANADIAKIKAPIQQDASGSSLTGAVAAQTISIAQQKKGIQDLADFRKAKFAPDIQTIDNVIKLLIENSVKDGQALASSLEGTNKLIKDPLDNFDAIIKASGSKADFENLLKALQHQLESLAPGDPQIAVLRAKIEQVKEIIKNAYDVTLTKGRQSPFLDLNKQIDDLLAKTNNLAQASGLTGYAATVQKITATYVDLNRQVDQFNKKVVQDVKTGRITQGQGNVLLAKSATVAGVLPTNENKELNDAKIAEAQRVATEIQRINDEFGVKAEQTRAKELAAVEQLADREIAKAKDGVLTRLQIEDNYQKAISKAKGNQGLLQQAEALRDAEIQAAQTASDEVVAIQNGKISAIKAINDKYLQIEQDLWDKISIIDTQAQTDIQGITESATAKIIKEWETRREAANKYYAQLKVLAASDLSGLNGLAQFNLSGFVQNAISGKQQQTNTNITNAEATNVNRELLKPFTEGIAQATKGVVQFFSTFNQQADQSFTALFSGVISKIEGVFNTIFENILDKQLSNALINGITSSGDAAQKSLTNSLQKGTKDGTKNLASQLSTALSIAGLAGSAISGLTPKTSAIGQGLGGALSGAASGALIGSVFGPAGTIAGGVIGGVAGLLGGIFGASKAQKELQAQQLAEQKQQTALLKASLAYTSTIIGRMTSQGVITGVDVGAFGQLTATVSGRDLQFVLDRNSNGR